MKLFRAFKVFIYLLHSRQWYIIAEDKHGRNHLFDANINIGQLIKFTNEQINEVVVGEELLAQAKELLK